ncbi:hypothetical protein NESM_000299400 [Novymonas esmeraldas]|uniref:Transmembrane protein n=1 Tax=Novymonas esmeraldas TaxID=1808958 RepID=A0AAW0FA68_9TRYP
MELCECVVDPNVLLLPATLIFVYLGGVVVSVVNTGNYFQKRRDVYANALIDAHLVFCVIGCVVFFCVSSVMWLWSSKYSFTHAERMWRLCVGLWCMCFFKDLPLLIIETHAFLQVGWQRSTFADGCFVMQVVFFVPSALVSSATISWYLAGFLERQFGNAMMVALQEKSYAPPPVSQVCAHLAVASEYPPPLPMHDMHYTIAHHPRHAPFPEYAIPRSSPARHTTVDIEAAPSVQPHALAAEHPRHTFVSGAARRNLVLAMGELPPQLHEDDAGPHPTII